MPNYLKMPKKAQVLALLELQMELPAHRSGNRRPSGDGQSLRSDAPVKGGQNVSRLRPSTTGRISRCSACRGFKCGQNVRRVRPKTGQNVPRLGATQAVRGDDLSNRDRGETRRRPEPAADLAGPG
jgi:hypothetical protein